MSGHLIIDPSEHSAGEHGSSKLKVSPQLYQHIHGLITGKKEEFKKNYTNAIGLEAKDIEQLDFKIRQLLEQYEVLALSSSFSAYYHNDEKKHSSSIQSFAYTATTSNNITQSVNIEYNISIMMPTVRQPQNFTLEILLSNRVAAIKKLKKEEGEILAFKYFQIFTRDTIEVKIEYVDYAVCRNFATAIDEWVGALHCIPESKIFTYLRSKADLAVPLTVNLMMAGIFTGLLSYFPEKIATSPPDILTKYLITSVVILYFGFIFSRHFGTWIAKKAHLCYEMSYINISRGDEKEIEISKKNNRTEFIKSIAGGIGSGVAATAVKFLISLIHFS
jgi:hypothetical protein